MGRAREGDAPSSSGVVVGGSSEKSLKFMTPVDAF